MTNNHLDSILFASGWPDSPRQQPLTAYNHWHGLNSPAKPRLQFRGRNKQRRLRCILGFIAPFAAPATGVV